MSGQTIFVRTGKEQLARVFGPDSLRWVEADDASVVPPSEWPIPRKLSRYVQSVKVRHKGSRARSTMVGDAGAEHPARVDSLEGEQDRGSPDLGGVTPGEGDQGSPADASPA